MLRGYGRHIRPLFSRIPSSSCPQSIGPCRWTTHRNGSRNKSTIQVIKSSLDTRDRQAKDDSTDTSRNPSIWDKDAANRHAKEVRLSLLRHWIRPSSVDGIKEAIFRAKPEDIPQTTQLAPELKHRASRFARPLHIRALYRTLGFLCEDPDFSPINWLRRLVHQHVDTRANGIAFVNTFDHFLHLILIKPNTGHSTNGYADRDAAMKTLHFYNAVISRFQKLQIPLGKEMIFTGVYLAAEARSTGGMMRYLQAFTQYRMPFRHRSAEKLLLSVKQWATSDSFSAWEGLRRKQELFTVLTGYRSDRLVDFGERRQECIRNLFGDDYSKLGPLYVETLQSIASAEALYDEWVHFTGSKLWQEFHMSSDRWCHAEALRCVEAFIRGLISTGEFKRAWAVVKQSGCKPGELSETTWSELFDHPEYIEKWQDGMSEQVLRKYEQQLALIEKALGVRWSGGMHVPISKEDCEDLPSEHVKEQ